MQFSPDKSNRFASWLGGNVAVDETHPDSQSNGKTGRHNLLPSSIAAETFKNRKTRAVISYQFPRVILPETSQCKQPNKKNPKTASKLGRAKGETCHSRKIFHSPLYQRGGIARLKLSHVNKTSRQNKNKRDKKHKRHG